MYPHKTHFNNYIFSIIIVLLLLITTGFGLYSFVMGSNFPNAQTIPQSYNLGPRPAAFTPIVDPIGGGTLTRITDNDGSSANIRHKYSAAQAFNADESVIFMAKGNVFLDASTLNNLPYNFLTSNNTPVWSPVNPKEMILAKDSTLYRWDVTNNSAAAAFNLSGYKEANIFIRMQPSNDGSKVAVVARKKIDDSYWAVGVDLITGAIGPEISFDTWNFSDLTAASKNRRANPSPTGKYLVLQGAADNEYHRTLAFDWQTGAHVYSSPSTSGAECPGDHGDFAVDVNGKDVFIGLCEGGGTGNSITYAGETVVLDFESGTVTSIQGLGSFSHYSGRNTKRNGWVYASSYKTTNANSTSEVVAFKTDGSRVEYYTDPQGYRNAYDQETQATPSPDGTKIIFSSSWNQEEPASTSNDYLLDLSELNASPIGFSVGQDFQFAQTTSQAYSLGSRPAPYVPVLDAIGGGTLTRITNNNGGANIRHNYGAAQAFNADETIIYMSKGRKFLDASSYANLPYNFLTSNNAPVWSPVNAKEMLLVKDSTFYRWDVTTNTAAVTFNLPGYKDANMYIRMQPSNDGTKAAVVARKKIDDSYWAVGIDLNTGAIGPEISFDAWNFSDLIGPTKDRRANPSPTGKYMILQGTADNEYQRTLAFNWQTGAHVYSSPSTNGIECPGGHGDLAIDVNGKDVFVGRCNGGGTGNSAIYAGETVVMDFETGTVTPIQGLGSFSHYSGRNVKREGWVYASSYRTTSASSRSRVLAFKTDGSRVEYYIDPQGYRNSYEHETHATPSPDGKRIIFSSSWNQLEPAGVSNDYLLDLRGLVVDELQTEVYLWLEGAFDVASCQMTSSLLTKSLLPSAQPYSAAPWNYTGTEGQGWSDTDYPIGSVDWVKVDFRETTDPASHLLSRAAVLLADGSLHFPNPITGDDLQNVNAVYMLIEHRNHMAIMTPQPISIDNGVIAHDFRTANSFSVNASSGQKEIESGVWAMFAGDADQSYNLGYEITGVEKLIFNAENGKFNEYNIADYNLDGDVSGLDKTIWYYNNGVFSGIAK